MKLKLIKGGTGVEIATLAIAAVGMAVAAYGAYSSAKSQQDTLNQKADQERQDAAVIAQAGEEAANRQRRNDKRKLESFGAAAASRGVVAHEGSALLQELDFASASELEAQHVEYGYKLGEREKRVQASFDSWQASRISPEGAMTMSLLSSAGSIAGSYATAGAGGGGGAKPSAYSGGYGSAYAMRGTPGEDF